MFGNNSNSSENRIDTSIFVQKPYLRSKYTKSSIEEGIDMKIQFRIKNTKDPSSIREATSKTYVDNLFEDPNEKKIKILILMMLNQKT